jgi:hypothetical protein
MSMATIRASVRFWCHDPAVYAFTDAEIDRFLALEAQPDITGLHPAQVGWTPTYDVLRAAGRAWMWLAGLTANAPINYKIGDVSVTANPNYCRDRARELMASSTACATRRDEPYPEHTRELYYDGDNPRHED